MVCTESGYAKSLEVSHQNVGVNRRGRKVGKRTWISSLSDRQSSTTTTSGRFGARMIERDFPLNIREIDDSTEFAFSCPCIHQKRQGPVQRKRKLAHRVVSLSRLSLALA